MKIDIITLHHVRNQGSLLQTYALQHFLACKGFANEVIDYVPVGLTLKKGVATIRKSGSPAKDLARKLCAAAVFSAQQRMVNRFLSRHVRLSERRYHRYKDLLENPPDADVYISGSDQIWNTQNANEPDDIKGYYLCFVPEGKKRISYASSIGKDSFDQGEAEMVRHALEAFQAISVREKQAVDLLASIGLKNAVHVVDPTLLLDADAWRAFCRHHKPPKQRYIFVYNLNRNPDIKKLAAALAEEKKLPIVNFADTLDFIRGAKNLLFNSPHEFLYYIGNAEYVLTDSFHGTVFSINLGRQFITFPAPRFNSRIESILEVFGLQNRLWQAGIGADVSALPEPIDYEIIQPQVDSVRQRCRQWLIDAIGQ